MPVVNAIIPKWHKNSHDKKLIVIIILPELKKETQVTKLWPGPQRVLTLFSDEAESIGMEPRCCVLHPIIQESSTWDMCA